MHYEENVINGVLCWRGTSNDKWIQKTPEQLTERIMLMTKQKQSDGSNAHLMTHVVPTNDLREHDTDGQCWCNPTVDDDLVVIHNSMDERESYEEGRKPQ